MSSIRLIAPPVSKPKATRFEIRIPGADLHPHYALSAIIAAGLRGIDNKMSIPIPPTSARGDKPRLLLPNTLSRAVERFTAPQSIAREIFDPDFVDFFAASREHELRVWREAVTDWCVVSSTKSVGGEQFYVPELTILTVGSFGATLKLSETLGVTFVHHDLCHVLER